MAQAMARAYDAPKPTVVYNAFPWSDRKEIDRTRRDRDKSGRPSVHWVSQTIGPGRGLETLCSALRTVETPLQVHLRGRCREEYHHHLRQRFPDGTGHTLHLHGLVSPDDLLRRVAEHDIGLALEPKAPDNKLYTVSNKILHYLLGGLAVVATDTAGQQEVAEEAGAAVRLCSPGDEDGLARQLRHFVVSETRLETAQHDALQAARDTFCWERQAPRFLSSVEDALQ
jgi:glycosyltransferase involved in cell wall biosynthesis